MENALTSARTNVQNLLGQVGNAISPYASFSQTPNDSDLKVGGAEVGWGKNPNMPVNGASAIIPLPGNNNFSVNSLNMPGRNNFSAGINMDGSSPNQLGIQAINGENGLNVQSVGVNLPRLPDFSSKFAQSISDIMSSFHQKTASVQKTLPSQSVQQGIMQDIKTLYPNSNKNGQPQAGVNPVEKLAQLLQPQAAYASSGNPYSQNYSSPPSNLPNWPSQGYYVSSNPDNNSYQSDVYIPDPSHPTDPRYNYEYRPMGLDPTNPYPGSFTQIANDRIPPQPNAGDPPIWGQIPRKIPEKWVDPTTGVVPDIYNKPGSGSNLWQPQLFNGADPDVPPCDGTQLPGERCAPPKLPPPQDSPNGQQVVDMRNPQSPAVQLSGNSNSQPSSIPFYQQLFNQIIGQ